MYLLLAVLDNKLDGASDIAKSQIKNIEHLATRYKLSFQFPQAFILVMYHPSVLYTFFGEIDKLLDSPPPHPSF